MASVPLTVLCTLFAMLAFAANSVFCRLALGRGAIDAASFTLIRLGSGATVLLLIHFLSRSQPRLALRRDGISAAALFLYAAAFSLAYRELAAGTGALLLFGSVQATMLAAGLLHGERPAGMEWLGWATALGGLVFLVAPGLHAPPPVGAVLMAVAGVAWGVYSLRGRRAGSPLLATASNFFWAVPLGVVFWLAHPGASAISGEGVLWAVLSGAIASGVGYSIWYAALPALTATRAATVQLIVPVFAAAGGVLFLDESVSLRLVLATLLVLGGVALAVSGRQRKRS
jgi:drug/metabolite transporter (DMT)-like permease